MTEKSYKISLHDILLNVTCFADGSSLGMHEPPSEIFNKIKNVHRHSEHEVFFVPGGEIKIAFEDSSMSFSNSAVIVPAGVGHYTILNSDDCFVAYLRIDRDESGEFSGQISDKPVSYELDDGDCFYLSRLAQAERAYPEDCQHLISLLFSRLIREIVPSDFSQKCDETPSNKYAFMLDRFIDEHYCERITLADLASELYLCERQVSRIIKREYNCSFSDFVNIKRLSVAAMLLKHTKMNISDIARSVGYENYNYFYRVFKKKYCVTPAIYRENSMTDNE